MAPDRYCDTVCRPRGCPAELGYYLVATRDIRAGECVLREEGRPVCLFSLKHVERCWTEDDRRFFTQHARPVSSHIWATWSADPTDWRPVIHSCWPNLWLGEEHSLDAYARLDIQAGEPLTIDHATFGPIAAFTCRCGVASCRGTIGIDDYSRHQEVRERYGTRVSRFVFESAGRREDQ